MRTEAVLAVTLLCLALLPILGVWGRVAVKSSLIRTALVVLWLILPTALIGTAISFSTPVVPPFEPANRPHASDVILMNMVLDTARTIER